MRIKTMPMVVAIAGLALPLLADGDAIERVVAIENVRASAESVSGKVVNQTGDQLENVRLLVADQFLWRDERHPRVENPGYGSAFVVRGPIPPHGTVSFRFDRPSSLEQRPDGDFNTKVSALEVTRRALSGTSGSTTHIERSKTVSERVE
jgi:hypothetical protein